MSGPSISSIVQCKTDTYTQVLGMVSFIWSSDHILLCILLVCLATCLIVQSWYLLSWNQSLVFNVVCDSLFYINLRMLILTQVLLMPSHYVSLKSQCTNFYQVRKTEYSASNNNSLLPFRFPSVQCKTNPQQSKECIISGDKTYRKSAVSMMFPWMID